MFLVSFSLCDQCSLWVWFGAFRFLTFHVKICKMTCIPSPLLKIPQSINIIFLFQKLTCWTQDVSSLPVKSIFELHDCHLCSMESEESSYFLVLSYCFFLLEWDHKMCFKKKHVLSADLFLCCIGWCYRNSYIFNLTLLSGLYPSNVSQSGRVDRFFSSCGSTFSCGRGWAGRFKELFPLPVFLK